MRKIRNCIWLFKRGHAIVSQGKLCFDGGFVIFCVSDIDCDYDYIMARALKSYRQHREKEKADVRKIQIRTNFLKRPYPRPKTAPPTRFTAAMRPTLLAKFPRPESALVPRSDAITEVHQANLTQEDIR